MAEIDIPIQIDQIHDRLKGTEITTGLLSGEKTVVRQKFLKGAFGEATKAARSEQSATPDQIKEVQDKAEAVRSWVIEQDQRYDPEMIRSSGNNGWLYKDEEFSVYADDSTDAVEPTSCSKLSITENLKDKNAEPWFNLEMDDTYRLEIEYIDPGIGLLSQKYQSGAVPVGQMNVDDYVVANSMLNNFIARKNIQFPLGK